MSGRSGIALIAVMAALMVMSALGLGLAVAVQTEARMDRADFDALQAEELARSGHEFAAFIEARGLAKTADFLAGSPFEAVAPGFHYRAHTLSGVVDIYFEADNGKINLSSAPADLINNFFEVWSGDPLNAARLAAAVEDWRDPDNEARPSGAEAADYSGGFSPRNAAIGIADLPLIRGFRAADFQLKLLHAETGPQLREPLGSFLTDAAAGNAVNANFASELMLHAVPGLTDGQIAGTINGRKNRLFDDANDLQARGGIPPDSPAWRYLTVARNAPAVLAVARLNGSGVVRRERRVVYSFANFFSATVESGSALGEIEKYFEITDER